MGGWDYYCALCGGPLHKPYWEWDEDEDNQDEGEDEDGSSVDPGKEYHPSILAQDDPKLDWLTKFRVVAETPDGYGTSPKQAWMSGPAMDDDLGGVTVQSPGDDPAFADWEGSLTAYDPGVDNPIAIPFHDDCRHLLAKYIGADSLDIETFFETLKGLNPGTAFLEDIDYKHIIDAMDQYWCARNGSEWLVFPPVQIPELQEYYENIPQHNPDEGAEAGGLQPPTHPDPYTRLPPEIMSNIMSCLDVKAMGRFRQASRAAYNVVLSNNFWKQKLLRDMPWLYDLPESAASSSTVDWKTVYAEMMRASQPRSKSVMRSLANRRRIWEAMLPQFAEPYLANLGEKMSDRLGQPAAFEGAQVTEAARLVHPEPRQVKSTSVALVPTVPSVADARAEVLIYFNSADEICGLGAENHSSPGLNGGPGNRPLYQNRAERVSIPDDDWVVGFVVTSQVRPDQSKRDSFRRAVGIEVLFAKGEPKHVGHNQGDKRLIHVPERRFIVGFKIHTSREGHLCRIALLHHREWGLVSGRERVADNNIGSYNMDALELLWRHELPPPGFKPSGMSYGYWSHDWQNEANPVQALIFGSTEEELADVTTIMADDQFGGFEVRYGNRPSRTIGPRHQAMKVLEIDGKGGERVVSFHNCTSNIPRSLRFVTNRNRQLVVGEPYSRELRSPSEWDQTNLPAVCGMLASYSVEDNPKANFEAVGCLLGPELGSNSLADMPDMSRQVGGFCWEPSALPPSIKAHGPIIGEREIEHCITRMGKTLPDDCPVINWVDCSRPLSRVRVTLCHSMNSFEIPLVSLVFDYADGDGEQASVGPRIFPPRPTDTDGFNGHPWCWCSLAGSKVKEEVQARPHYETETWEVGGKRLGALRAWLTAPEKPQFKGRAFSAIQLVTEGGLESPIWRAWGHTGDGDEIREIKFVGGGARAVGLKCFIGFNGRAVTREDSTVQAIQALVKAGE